MLYFQNNNANSNVPFRCFKKKRVNNLSTFSCAKLSTCEIKTLTELYFAVMDLSFINSLSLSQRKSRKYFYSCLNDPKEQLFKQPRLKG